MVKRLVLPVLPVLVALPAVRARGEGTRTAVDITYLTQVSLGQQPMLKIRAREPIGRLEVRLQDETGQAVGKAFSPVGVGQTVEMPLPAHPGSRHYSGTITVRQAGEATESSVAFDVVVAAPLQVQINKADVDVAGRKLVLAATRPPASVSVVVLGTEGQRLGESEQNVSGAAALQPVTVKWSAAAGDVARIDVKVTDLHGYFAGVSLFPWSVHIPHEEVNFAVDSAAIDASEKPKLEDSLRKITSALQRHKDLGPIKLFIAGHTDTQGKTPYNLKLSLQRAQSIASYFRKRGLRVPIAYEGFGEHALRIGTADETDEIRNRRVDYILSVEEPQLNPTKFSPRWKSLR